MYRQNLFAILRSFFCRNRSFALCPARSRVWLRSMLCLVGVLLAAPAAFAITATGSVSPADNPFTSADEGIPFLGNYIVATPGTEGSQIYFEGRPAGNPPNTNQNFDIIVGVTSFGSLLISGEQALRDQDLIIGDSGNVGNGSNAQFRYGTGIVRITDPGSLYNNDPLIIPAGLPSNFSSVVPRLTTVGFDLYVGRSGNGTLEISAGGRAEIQDSVLVGDQVTATGSLIVDGLDSFLGSGGFNLGTNVQGAIHHMILGRRGTGSMTISNGATVQTEAVPIQGTGGGNVPIFGAAIGSQPAFDNNAPLAGGSGTVTVDGANSDWVIGGSLQVGGFHFATTGSLANVAGDKTLYASQTGRGNLYVRNGGLVNILPPLDSDGRSDPSTSNQLDLAIGRFGRVELSGGTISVGRGIGNNPGSGTTNEGRNSFINVLNDGVIKGGGRIETGTFNNRYYGEVRVDPGNTLIIDSSSRFQLGTTDAIPITNFGLIEVIGTQDQRAELEFVRAPAADSLNPLATIVNRPVATVSTPAPTTFDGGLISAQHATLRFSSGSVTPGAPPTIAPGMRNEGVMAFTAGNNIIKGFVVNQKDPNSGTPADLLDPKFIIGPNTSVVVEDDFTNAVIGPVGTVGPPFGAITNLGLGASLTILDQSTFVTNGLLQVSLGPSNTSSKIIATGDMAIDGKLAFTLDPGLTLTNGSAFQLLTFGTQAYHVNASGTVPVPDTSNPIAQGGSGFTSILAPAGFAAQYPNLDPVARRVGQALYLYFLDPNMVGGGAIGPDFNGDGVVNLADLAIWQANVGITSGASVLQGDADGDGDVDGDDFLFWQRNFGQPQPWTGAGAGGAVPEPSSIALLVSSGLLSLAFRRRRAQR
jgi:T5SS/PEP-CTERM-associated repeat protein